MNGKAFLDTNVLIYLYSDKEREKRNTAYQVLGRHDCVTSIQIFNEASNVWFKKFQWDSVKIQKHLDNIELVCGEILAISRNTINIALGLKDSYKFSYYDSLMLASALEGNCEVIFTEDMQDGQVVEKNLRILNPFRLYDSESVSKR